MKTKFFAIIATIILMTTFVQACGDLFGGAKKDESDVLFYPASGTAICPSVFGTNFFNQFRPGEKIKCSATYKQVVAHIDGEIFYNFTVPLWQESWDNVTKAQFQEHFFWADVSASNEPIPTLYSQDYDDGILPQIGTFQVGLCLGK